MLTNKPDCEEVLNRFEAWWERAIIDRPLVSLAIPRPEAECRPPPRKHHATLRDRWMDTAYVVECADVQMGNTLWYADSLPVAWPNLGPEVFSAFYGCHMEYREETAWSTPILADWSEKSVEALRLTPENLYFRKVMEMTDALIEEGRGKFIVGYTDLHSGGDAIAAFRDPQQLLIDTIEHPAEIKSLCERVTTDFLHVYDLFHERLSAAGMPSTTWCPATCKGKFHIPSNDFSCMIADRAFEELFLPGIIRECRHMDRCMYHLDGPQALRYLDRLLEIPEIHAIQWVPGAGRESWREWIGVYQRIQQRKKALQILSIPATELHNLFEVLSPEGVWISAVSGISSEEEAEAVLRLVAGWTRRR